MSHNLHQCRELVRRAVAAGAQALFLPEASDYIATSPSETISLAKSLGESPFVQGLQAEAKDAKIDISVGVHEPAGDGKVKNTLLWIKATGVVQQRYQKLHLFDVDIKDGPVMHESDTVEKGSQIVTPFESPVGRIGMAICFDLRFPELSLALRRQEAQIITYPSAFTVPTGEAHWHVLLRCRAIETQSYIVAAAQAGRHNARRASYGHSMIVDPWGKILAELSGDSAPEIATAEIDLDCLRTIRNEIPLLRRNDVYPQV